MSARTPTPREVIRAADIIGDTAVDFLTDGLGLSGASPRALRSIVVAAALLGGI